LPVRVVEDDSEPAEAVATSVGRAQIVDRHPRARLALTLAGAVALSAFAAACGGSTGKGVAHVDSRRTTTSGSDSSGSASPGDRRGALVAFAACMRRHGLANARQAIDAARGRDGRSLPSATRELPAAAVDTSSRERATVEPAGDHPGLDIV
jgi:hypothetical protein